MCPFLRNYAPSQCKPASVPLLASSRRLCPNKNSRPGALVLPSCRSLQTRYIVTVLQLSLLNILQCPCFPVLVQMIFSDAVLPPAGLQPPISWTMTDIQEGAPLPDADVNSSQAANSSFHRRSSAFFTPQLSFASPNSNSVSLASPAPSSASVVMHA